MRKEIETIVMGHPLTTHGIPQCPDLLLLTIVCYTSHPAMDTEHGEYFFTLPLKCSEHLTIQT